MNNRKTVVLFVSTFLLFTLVTLSTIGGSATQVQAASPTPRSITLKAITFCGPTSASIVPFKAFSDTVNKRSRGEIIIERVGGPEVVPLFEIAGACRKGVVDMGVVFVAGYKALVPGVDLLTFSELSLDQERQRGAFDFLQESHRKVGLFFLAAPRTSPPGGFMYLLTNKRVKTPYDLKGQRFATEALFDAFLKELGTVPLTMTDAEIYTGLERGLLDGYGNPLVRVLDHRLEEVTKYIINHPFYHGRQGLFVNLDAWNKIPKHLQDLMKQAAVEAERAAKEKALELEQSHWQKLKDAKVEAIKFSPADAKWFVETSYRAAWERALKRTPEVASRLKELLK